MTKITQKSSKKSENDQKVAKNDQKLNILIF